MTEEPNQPDVPSLADVAQESPEASVAHESEVVGDHPDVWDTVPTDDAQ